MVPETSQLDIEKSGVLEDHPNKFSNIAVSFVGSNYVLGYPGTTISFGDITAVIMIKLFPMEVGPLLFLTADPTKNTS